MAKQKPTRGLPLNRSHPLACGLELCLPMWEGTGGKVYDVSGNGHVGTLTNMDAPTDWVGTEYGWGLDFDGTDDCVVLPSLSLGNYTVVWRGQALEHDSSAKSAFAADNYPTTPRHAVIIKPYSATNTKCEAYVDGTGGTATDVAGIFAGETHVVLVRNGATVQPYISGVASGSGITVGTGSTTLSNIRLGCHYFSANNQEFCSSTASGLAIYSRALTAPEVQQLYHDPWCIFRSTRVSVFYPQAPTSTHPIIASALGGGAIIGSSIIRRSA